MTQIDGRTKPTKTKPCEVCKVEMEYIRNSKTTCSSACREAKRVMGTTKRIPKRALKNNHKWCPMCESEQPIDNFYTSPSGKVFTYCRPCKRSDGKRRLRASKGLPEDAELFSGTRAPIGSTYEHSTGYVLEKVGADKTAHHRADRNGWVFQHILVAENKYQMKITRDYTVHHQNGDRSDNRPENLELRHGPHGKGADMIPFLLRDPEGRELAIKVLEGYGYTVSHDIIETNDRTGGTP